MDSLMQQYVFRSVLATFGRVRLSLHIHLYFHFHSSLLHLCLFLVIVVIINFVIFSVNTHQLLTSAGSIMSVLLLVLGLSTVQECSNRVNLMNFK